MSTLSNQDPVMNEVDQLQSELITLKQMNGDLQSKLEAVLVRNARVELDKGWETSVTRFLCVAATTYITMNLILWTIGGPFPPIHAIVPTCGYMLSTLSLPRVKRWWMSSEAKKSFT